MGFAEGQSLQKKQESIPGKGFRSTGSRNHAESEPRAPVQARALKTNVEKRPVILRTELDSQSATLAHSLQTEKAGDTGDIDSQRL